MGLIQDTTLVEVVQMLSAVQFKNALFKGARVPSV